MDLKNSSVLVTGGGTGIGRAVALAFAQEGCRVAVSGRRAEKLGETASLWTGVSPVLCCTADVTNRKSVERLFAWASAALGPLDILVLSAGSNIRRRSMAEIDPDDWDRVLQINATGAFNCIHAALPRMRERQAGLIINISSVAGKRASLLGGVAYNASKFAATALGTSVGLEEAKNGIRVTNIYPGEVNTPILDERPEPVTEEHRSRILQPADIALVAVMIARLPPRAHIPELVIKPTHQFYA
jgi:NAD(P)-dependent dehydrogenase (short-subunit alcohol dehydrogenase family)